MPIQNVHIFDYSGNCLFSLHPSSRPDSTTILYGFLYSLKSFTQHVSPMLVSRDNNFIFYHTAYYQLVFYEFPTSVKFVLIVTDPKKSYDSDYYREVMQQLYRNVYVEYHVKNPVAERGKAIESNLFRQQLNFYLGSLNLWEGLN